MDFASPPCVIDALSSYVRRAQFGYTESDASYRQSIVRWFETEHQWTIHPEWITVTPGVVFALATAVKAFSEVGDDILILTPVYYPFFDVIQDNHRNVVSFEWTNDAGTYTLDFEGLRQCFENHSLKMMLLCNPHNPLSRVLRPSELEAIVSLAKQYGVIVVSDEIHMDLVFSGQSHYPLAKVDETFDHWIICTSPSKTFNLAAFQISNIMIKHPDIRQRFRQEVQRVGYSQPNGAGLIACESVYENGAPWLKELKDYLYGNYQYLCRFLSSRCPCLIITPLEATYLVWIDFRALAISDLNHFILHQAKLWLDDGPLFGEGGSGFQRINIACPRATLTQALNQLCDALDRL